MGDNETLALWAYTEAMDSVETPAYQAWLARDPELGRDAGHDSMRTHVARSSPLISLIVVDEGDKFALRDTIETVQNEERVAVELIVAGRSPDEFGGSLAGRANKVIPVESGSAAVWQAAALAAASGRFVGFVSAGDRLPPGTMACLEALLSRSTKIDILYTDEDWFDEDGRGLPRFKSAWDPEAHIAFDLFGRLCLMRGDLVRGVGGLRTTTAPAHLYDLHLRVAAASRASAIYHVPRVCYSRRKPLHVPPDGGEMALAEYAKSARAAATEATLGYCGRNACVKPSSAAPFINHIVWPLPEDAPLVSVIVPTRDRSELLRTCAQGVLKRTEYQKLELIIVDNGSRERATLDLFDELRRDPRVRIIRDDASFNFSRLINLGASHARGSMLAILNNDIEITTQGWLAGLVALAARREIGCVGAKLLYGTLEIQHAGIVLQEGPLAMHAFRMRGRSNLGYDGQLAATRAYLAVTAACLVVRRQLFDTVGGFDESFEVAFNDVDFCLKAADLGYLNVCSSNEELIHHEGMSRGSDSSDEHRSRFARELALLDRRWTDQIRADPYGNPNLCWGWTTDIRLSDLPQPYFLR